MIRRQMVTLPGGRQVHLQRAGEGPPLFVLHQSPRSSNDMRGVVERLARHYSVLAMDTPGNGLSDPTGIAMADATMDDFADSLAAVMDALEIPQALVYGFHTGAMAAIAFAARHPHRAPLIVANGFITMDPAAVDDIRENYLVPFVPEWTGSHLNWWWVRLRDQYIFFPFHRQTEATRSGMDIPPVAELDRDFLEFLRAGDGYRVPYYAAFSFDGVASVAKAGTRLAIIGDETDILYPYLELLGDVPGKVSVHRYPDPESAEAGLLRILAQTERLPDPPAIAMAQPIAGKLSADFVQTPHGSVRVLINREGSKTPALFLHDLGGSSATVARFMTPWIGQRPVIALDLPGGGESVIAAGGSVDVQLSALDAVLDAFGSAPIDVIGFGTGANLALAFAERSPARVKHIVAPRGFAEYEIDEGLDALPEHTLLPLRPDFYGSHLQVLWTMLRHRALFAPWTAHRAGYAIPGSVDIAPEVTQAEFVAWLQALPALKEQTRELLAMQVDEIAARIATPIVFASQPLRGRRLKARRADIDETDLPLDPGPLAQALDAILPI